MDRSISDSGKMVELIKENHSLRSRIEQRLNDLDELKESITRYQDLLDAFNEN
jgi:hypothetical protein